MLDRAYWAIIVGGIISVLAFIPLTVWQYRRYGRFTAARMAWMVVWFVYLMALVSYTLLPMPTDWDQVCAVTREPVLTIRPYFVQMIAEMKAAGGSAALFNPMFLQLVLNVALFVPLGLILSEFHQWKWWAGIPAGLGVSLLVELTQYTGNWGMSPCAYRLADVGDLLTNTLGTVVGYLLGALIPNMLRTTDELEAMRDLARPVTRGRRLWGLVLDGLMTGGAILATYAAVGLAFSSFAPNVKLTVGSMTVPGITLAVLAAATLAVFLGLSATKRSASVGQRIVWLHVEPNDGRQWRTVLRTALVTGPILASLIVQWTPLAGVGLVVLLVETVSILFTADGLAAKICGVRFVDARADERLVGKTR